jgi:hypothetical protein
MCLSFIIVDGVKGNFGVRIDEEEKYISSGQYLSLSFHNYYSAQISAFTKNKRSFWRRSE